MITDFILDAIFAGINALLTLMPSLSISQPPSAFQAILGDIQGVNRIIPIAAIAGVIGAGLATRIALTGWDFLLLVYHQFWGSE